MSLENILVVVLVFVSIFIKDTNTKQIYFLSGILIYLGRIVSILEAFVK